MRQHLQLWTSWGTGVQKLADNAIYSSGISVRTLLLLTSPGISLHAQVHRVGQGMLFGRLELS